MHGNSWELKDDIVGIRTERDEFVVPAAMEIFKARFQGASTVMGIACGNPIEQLPGVRFAKFPADPALLLTRDGNSIASQFGVLAAGEFVPTREDIDQVVHRGCWHPIDLVAMSQGRDAATQMGALGGSISLGTLVKLRLATDLPFRLLERVNDAPPTAQLAPRHLVRRALHAELYPYQADGIDFLNLVASQSIGCILADEMGLGKTLQVIGMLVELSFSQGLPSLVVAPASLLENWRREIALFAPTLAVRIHAGSGRAGTHSALGEFNILVTSYETVVRDLPMLSSLHWAAVVLDEAQAIKNPDAQRTQAVKQLQRNVSVAVSGTPLENSVDDLWSVSDFCLPGVLGEISQFRQSYSDEVGDATRLGRAVAPLIVRRLVKDVADDLPERIEIQQPIDLSEGEAKDYVAVRDAVLSEHGIAGALVATTILRSFCADASLVKYSTPNSPTPGAKLQRLLELLEEIFSNGEKALIFSSFHGVADLLASQLPRHFPDCHFGTIDGRTDVIDRQPMVDDFFAHTGSGALFLNPKAAGTGLNITAANHVIHFNPEWNPALTAQATARAYRRKQTRPVTVHHLYHPGTVEEVIIQRSRFKQSLADQAVTGHDGALSTSDLALALSISPLDIER